jgi:hypothetical protein
MDPHVFDLLFRLPEVQVRADGRAEDGNHRDEISRRPADMRQDQQAAELQPVHMRDRQDCEVGEERKREPLQHGNVARVLKQQLHRNARDGEKQHV